jgi:NADH:ubiquinone oxidoreductase subunit 6 (subunit J)
MTVLAALRVITARNPVHAVLFLVLAFFNVAGLWMLLQAEFLALALIMVYVGAVMVLFLFVVMMLDINIERVRQGFWSNLPLGALVGGLMVAEMAVVLSGRYFGLANLPPHESAGQLQQHQGTGAGAVHRLRLSLRNRLGHPAGGHHRAVMLTCASARTTRPCIPRTRSR